jgi:hypothetical protein
MARVEKLITLLEAVRTFHAIPLPIPPLTDAFSVKAAEIHSLATQSHPDLAVSTGTLILYVGGRFESFVRAQFEDLCERIASKKKSFDQLPREMRNNLLKFTAEVVSNPRKYGHGDKGAENFMRVLALNLSDKSKLESINTQCLSVTHENMREETFKDLFERIGIKDIWLKIGNQAEVMTFFETADAGEAKNKATSYLNTFMNQRNNIAHPSGTVYFPDPSQVRNSVQFFLLIAQVLSKLVPVLDIQMGR